MAAPTLFAQGSVAAVTTGSLTVTLPSHQADDILLLCVVCWVPNTAGDAAQIPTPAGWALLGTQIGQPAGTRDGWSAWFWKRATSGAETNPVVSRGASWDTGTDTCFAGRAYTVRGCIATGDPWDAQAGAGPYTTANQAVAAVTVSGTERMVVQFFNSMDNQAAGTISGWTAGTAATTATGTDAGFQTFRKDNVSASTGADASTAAAPAQGAYAYIGISFKPPAVSPTRGRSSWAEFEATFVATRGRLSWAELENPLVPTRGRVSWAECDTPLTPTRGRTSQAEVEVPSAANPTRGRVAQAEVEAPAVATRGRLSFAELDVPDLAGSYMSYLALLLKGQG